MQPSRFRKADASPFERGLEAMASRRYAEAIQFFSAAADASDKAAEALSKRGVCRLRLGDAKAAASDFEAALQIDPKCAAALTNLGNVALEEGKLEEARARYEAAISADPEYALAHHNFGVLLKREGKVRESVIELRKAAKLESGSMWDWLAGKRRR